MKKTAVISGTSKGIGLALAKLYLQKGFQVIGTSRKGQTDDSFEHENFQMLAVDFLDVDSITSATSFIKEKMPTIDVLINNAGVGSDIGKPLPQLDYLRETINVNLYGTIIFSEALLPLLKKNAVLAMIGSKMGSIEICQDSSSPAYRISKAALNMYVKTLSLRSQKNFKVAAIHPGWVQTELTHMNQHAPLTTIESAQKIFAFLSSNFSNGVFWDVIASAPLSW